MNIEQFNYTLPEHFIAQTPLVNRDESKMFVLDPDQASFAHKKFSDIINYLQPGDCLVLNDTKVLPARLYGVKPDTGGKIEILLLHEKANDEWEVLAKPARRLPVGSELTFGEGNLRATCIDQKDYGGRVLKFSYEGIFHERLNELGEMPLPPYIHETLEDQERYQTIYAKEQGSAAAPTAGLHMTDEIFQALKEKGIQIVFVTLHVGLDTFRPVATDNIKDHKMHAEFYMMDEATAKKLNNIRKDNGRIFALGTTTTRVLETIATENNGLFHQSSGWTDIFIYPPYDFQAIDGLITNFHLPKSTLLMLVSAFAGRDLILKAYEEAKEKDYRFFSFGDAMLILPSKDD